MLFLRRAFRRIAGYSTGQSRGLQRSTSFFESLQKLGSCMAWQKLGPWCVCKSRLILYRWIRKASRSTSFCFCFSCEVWCFLVIVVKCLSEKPTMKKSIATMKPFPQLDKNNLQTVRLTPKVEIVSPPPFNQLDKVPLLF